MRLGTRILGVIGSLAMVTGSAWADQPAAGTSNQQIANDVASMIATKIPSGGYTVDLECRSGVVTVRGTVSSPTQMKQILDIVRSNKSVSRVTNELKVTGSVPVTPAGYQDVSAPPPMPADALEDSNQALAPITPEFQFPSGAAPQYDMPFMPTFAWPAHAPYPNYSAVQYPRKYPSRAWPYIGPFTPYPEVPIDWREVKMHTWAGLSPLALVHAGKQPPPDWHHVSLRWDDGHWYYRFHHPWWVPRCLAGGLAKSKPVDPCTPCVDLGSFHVRFRQTFCTHRYAY